MSEPGADFPLARRVPKRGYGLIGLLTGLLLAAGLLGLIYGAGPRPTLTLYFPDGHGLHPGDSLRYRGIAVGVVTGLALAPDFQKVTVKIELSPSAVGLARVGSRFWIERPALGVDSIRGLDTLVEGRYLAVAPGAPDAAPQWIFEGLETAPWLEVVEAGSLELWLDSPERHQLRPGTPVLFRGVKIGKVNQFQLKPDGSGLSVRLVINAAFRDLIRTQTVFWFQRPLDVQMSLLGGVNFNVGALETLATGSIALATPTVSGEPVPAGQRFNLQLEEPRHWREWQPAVSLAVAP